MRGVAGTWKELTDSVNSMASNLTGQVRNIAEVTTAVANGDLSKKITVDVKGEMLALKNTVNTMVDQLNAFAGEVTRVAREVGTEGKLGGQATVTGVAGVWKGLTDNVNSMAANLTTQVRGIARVVTAVAGGDLKRKLTLEARGEIAELAETINSMIDTLALFGDQVTTVAREVGIEGCLGGQANVPSAQGIWRDLTDNVNRLAGNLTTQVRAIAEVSTAVAKGDLTRTVTVQAAGEVAALKDNVNQMISNLKETTRKNTEQDWLKTNLAKFTRMLQGQRDVLAVSRSLLSELSQLVGAQHGVFYIVEDGEEKAEPSLRLLSAYAFRERKMLAQRFALGEGLVGQCAIEKERILLSSVPSDHVRVVTGLGESTPRSIVVLPILFEGNVKAVIELASFDRFSEIHLAFLDQLTESVGIVLNTIAATTRTEDLLKQSQALTEELQTQQGELTATNKRLEDQARILTESEQLLKSQQEELQTANEELEERARLLSAQKSEVERTNLEVEQARKVIEEKAAQLALRSRYKSEFLANMSHELRTPLNSLLILAKMLADNPAENLTEKQVEYAQTIHGSGHDLLELINGILDLAKIESGTMSVDLGDLQLGEVRGVIDRMFRPTAEGKRLDLRVDFDPGLPQSIHTDGKRVQQVLKNLLSNALKFTEKGTVSLRAAPATRGWTPGHEVLDRAERVVSFTVTDTGIGIPRDKHTLIFEAFQQADAGTSRRYGGTGLGLSISREIVDMLGGDITLESTVGQGSTFTVYLPVRYVSRTKKTDRKIEPLPWQAGGTPATTQTTTHVAETRTLTSPVPVSYPMPEPELFAASESESEGEGGVSWEDQPAVSDDRGTIAPGDRVLLVVEDDMPFVQVLTDLARTRGFKVLAARSSTEALKLMRTHPISAATLDLRLPGRDGWVVLDRLKHDPRTRHVPVHIISVTDETQRGLRSGAAAVIQKPVAKDALEASLERMQELVEGRKRKLLIVEDDENMRKSMVELIGNGDVVTTVVGTGAEALTALRAAPFDCVVLDLRLPDMPGTALIEQMRDEARLRHLPIIVYTGKELSRKEESQLSAVTEAIIVKGVRSPERLLDETALFLHRVEANLPPTKRRMIQQSRRVDHALEGKKVLVVDDDVRNIFALTTALEAAGVTVIHSESGPEALETLPKHPDLSAILLDIMMPVMDGYETTRRIRAIPRFRFMPIIALTAKAMQGDREKCIDAGVSDYLAKPIDMDQLLSLLRVWLYR